MLRTTFYIQTEMDKSDKNAQLTKWKLQTIQLTGKYVDFDLVN